MDPQSQTGIEDLVRQIVRAELKAMFFEAAPELIKVQAAELVASADWQLDLARSVPAGADRLGRTGSVADRPVRWRDLLGISEGST